MYDLLDCFHDIVIGGRVNCSEGEAGIIPCASKTDKAPGCFKIKTEQTLNAANHYRLYCREVARMNIDGIERILYEVYRLEKMH